jgi:hypothetical protein
VALVVELEDVEAQLGVDVHRLTARAPRSRRIVAPPASRRIVAPPR